MHSLTRRQLAILIALTVVWGVNWPVMKLGVNAWAPLTFRTWSMWLGVPVLAGVLLALRVPFRLPRRHWPELLMLALTNMMVWHACMIVGLRFLTSGRAAILAYTMPVFAAVIGALWWGQRMPARGWLGVAAAALGVLLLLWHEVVAYAGRPLGVGLLLLSAAVWAIGTHQMRRTRIEAQTLTLVFWMTVLSAAVITLLALVIDGPPWALPPRAAIGPTVFNAVLIFGFAQAAWLYLARTLPPIASTLSVMLIPVVGVLSGALWLGEPLHWQDAAAVALMVAAIASVLWPARATAPPRAQTAPHS